MIALDTNILVYAHRAELPHHAAALRAVDRLANADRSWGLPWPCVHEFLAVVTNPRIFRTPTPTSTALAAIQGLCEQRSTRLLGETSTHLQILERLCSAASVTGAKIHDARVAAICLGHSITELWTADRDFSYFPDLVTANPLVAT